MIDLRDQLQTSLGSAYTLERELGGGGMSRVFVARDETLGREVVVKVLAPELAQELSAERFTREIRIAAGLQEPHIVPVLSAGLTSEGLPWYTMPFVSGESLRARLDRSPVSTPEARKILEGVARALAYAHAHGIVHRDIKPENVLLSSGTAVVTDFGIAKALAASRTEAPDATLTSVGMSIGTPAYMAPEQAAGGNVDARADLYSWGVMAYELLAGAHPFAGRTGAQQMVAAHIAEAPRALNDAAPHVPAPLSLLVMRCLAKDVAERPPSAAALIAVLESATSGANPLSQPVRGSSTWRTARSARVIAALAVVIVAGAGAMAWRRSEATEAAGNATEIRRIAVLPFENLGRPEDRYVVDGLTEEIRRKLASVPGLQVTPRASSNHYRDTEKLPDDVAQELGVRYLLTGTVRSEPGTGGRPARVRVSPELVELSKGTTPTIRWQQDMDANTADVFAMESDIASRVATAMNVALGGGARARLAEVPTRNAAAYDAYARGEEASDGLLVLEGPGLRRALGYYTQAVSLDSTFTEAWVQRARAATMLYNNSVRDPALALEARNAAERAVSLAPDRAGGYIARGAYYGSVERDYARALESYQHANRLAPTDVRALTGVALAELYLHRTADAVRDVQSAVVLDPRAAGVRRVVVIALLAARRFPEAQSAADAAVALAPLASDLVERRMITSVVQGDLAGAQRVLAATPPEFDRSVTAAHLAGGWDLPWVLDDAEQRRVLALRPDAFDNDRGNWGLAIARVAALRGQHALSRAYADSARVALEEQLRVAPSDARVHARYALVLAILGRTADALLEGGIAQRLDAEQPNFFEAARNEVLIAHAYLLAGAPERAISALEAVLPTHGHLSAASLRIDPTFAALRRNPRFARLVATSTRPRS